MALIALNFPLVEVATLIHEGKVLVDANCSRCHAVGATGDSSNPKVRTLHQRHPTLALRDPLSRGIAAQHDEMPKFKFTDDDADKIIAYINGLPDSAKKSSRIRSDRFSTITSITAKHAGSALLARNRRGIKPAKVWLILVSGRPT